jgi:hypothetical protein
MCPKSESSKSRSKPDAGKVEHTKTDGAKWQFAPDQEDTQRILKALDIDALTLEESSITKTAATTFNPYDKTTLTSTKPEPRRSLDDLRKLSEQIKKSKQYVRPPKGRP